VIPDRWTRLDAVFADALEQPPEARAAFVADACGNDDALRADTLLLLEAADQSGDFLAGPAIDTLAQDIASDGRSLRPGERVGVYRVERLLGSGGSGEVWRAHDERLGRDVAIKVLLPHFAADADRMRRFAQEARAAGALNHANIVAVYDVGEHGGAPFLVTECLDGESLRKRLESGPLSVDDTLPIAVQIAHGLAAAHARGFVHRDLKPDNVFLRADGCVKILDFGLAKLHRPKEGGIAGTAHTLTGAIAGTPPYMAPEQVRGEAVDGRSDIFSLGAMLYEMLTGRRPFAGRSTIETLHAILTVDVAPVSHACATVPPALAHIVDRCLEKHPEKRFQNADELVVALEAAAVTRHAFKISDSLSVLGHSAAGTRVGNYLILAHRGRGNFGDVYRAHDTRLHRDVIVEILRQSEIEDRERFMRVQRQVQVLTALEHANIAATYGLHEIEGLHLLVRELVEGRSLTERIAESSLPLDEAVAIGGQVAAALEAAHDHGIVHGDLRPSNIILRNDRTVKVLAFGFTDAATVPESGASYRSPEQLRGERIDKRADLWAFGCVLFEMLSGRAAYAGERSNTDAEQPAQHEPDWNALPSTTPRHVHALLGRCLQSDAARRFRDAGDARLELEEPAEPMAPAAPKRMVRPSTLILWSVAIISLIAAIALAVAYRRPGEASRPPMRFISVTNFAGVEAQPALSPDGRSVAFVSNRNGQWDIYVSLVSGGNLVQITNDPNLESGPRWSPDGARLVFARLNEKGLTDIWVVPAFGGAARRIVLNAATPAWSRDGRLIAYRSNDTIWISGDDGGNPREITRRELPTLWHSQPAFARHGNTLAFVRQIGRQRSELAVVDIKTGAVRNITNDGALALSPVWSPDDRFIYFTSSRGGTLSVWKIEVASGRSEPITAGQDNNEEIDLSADGTRLAFSSARGNIGLAEMSLDSARQNAVTWLTTDSARGETAPRYSPDGRRIVYFTNRNGLETDNLWVTDADGRNARRIVEDGRLNLAPRWSADGEAILFWSRAADPWAGPTSGELRRVSLTGGAPQVLAIKPWLAGWGDIAGDGRVIVRTSARAGEIYDPPTNQRQPVVNLFGEAFWSPDGRSFAFALPPSTQPPSDAGLWLGTARGIRRLSFPDWVMWLAFTRHGQLLVLEGRADLTGMLWRVDPDTGQHSAVAQVALLLRHNELSPARFDVHPDGRRIVLEARPVYESDIGVIDNVR
jgi:serine/threonine protein kinase/Tol biopolymer transport system component